MTSEDHPIELPEHSPVSLPDIFPMDEVVVDGEEHIYQVYQGNQGPLPEDEYTLNKAPITEIRSVRGVNNESEYEFEQGVDYKLSQDSERIVWINGDRPDPGTVFYVTYRSDSIIGRYGETADEELDVIKHTLEEAIKSKFISTAEGVELDRIGSLFGPVIGKRRGRDDEQYRIYLESVVQSFISRGTVTGIKLAISAGTDIPVEDITIDEDFENNEYEVIVIPNTPVDVALLETISDIADPSGIKQILTRFPIFEDTGITDSTSISEGIQFSEDMTVADSVANFGFGNEGAIFEGVAMDETVAIDPNKNAFTDTMFGDDAFAIDPRTTETFEDVDATDTIENVEPVNKNAHRWENTSDPDVETRWTFFEWTEILDFDRAAADTAFFDDAVTIPAKAAITTDTSGSVDSVTIRFNVASTTDTTFTDDAVTIPPKDATTADTGGSDDTVTNVSQTLVAWDTNDWNSLKWTQEHN